MDKLRLNNRPIIFLVRKIFYFLVPLVFGSSLILLVKPEGYSTPNIEDAW